MVGEAPDEINTVTIDQSEFCPSQNVSTNRPGDYSPNVDNVALTLFGSS